MWYYMVTFVHVKVHLLNHNHVGHASCSSVALASLVVSLMCWHTGPRSLYFEGYMCLNVPETAAAVVILVFVCCWSCKHVTHCYIKHHGIWMLMRNSFSEWHDKERSPNVLSASLGLSKAKVMWLIISPGSFTWHLHHFTLPCLPKAQSFCLAPITPCFQSTLQFAFLKGIKAHKSVSVITVLMPLICYMEGIVFVSAF